jgi:prepilin-type N-terminal cleavage/methylation domain-containing protein
MKNRNFRTLKGLRQRQAGYTLVELAISVSIISLLIVGSLTGVQGLLAANKVNKTLTQTTVATANISKLSAATGNAILNNVTLRQLGVWEQSAIRITGLPGALVTTVENPFAGTINVALNTAAVGNFPIGSGYWYKLTNIPEASCASLATSFFTTSPGIFISAAPTAAAITPGIGGAYREPGQPDNLARLNAGCTSGAGDSVEVALFIPN